MLENQSLYLLLRSNRTPTLPPQRRSQDPKAHGNTKLAVSSTFCHLCFFSCSVQFPFLTKCVEFVSQAERQSQIDVCVCVCVCVCTPAPEHAYCTNVSSRQTEKKSKVTVGKVWCTESSWNLISKGYIWSLRGWEATERRVQWQQKKKTRGK